MKKKSLTVNQIKEIYRLKKEGTLKTSKIAQQLGINYYTVYSAIQFLSKYWAPQNVKKANRKNKYMRAIGELKVENMRAAVKATEHNGEAKIEMKVEEKNNSLPFERLASAMSTFQHELETCVELIVDQQIGEKIQVVQKENKTLKEQLEKYEKIVSIARNSNWITNLKNKLTVKETVDNQTAEMI